MEDLFEIKKKEVLRKKDKSSKGGWDKRISKLCEKINKSEDYYTTSSCSGRVVLIMDDDKKKIDLFLFKSHDKLTFDGLKKETEKARRKGDVKFKQEPAIIHVVCRNIDCANRLLKKAREIGWKRSGMIAYEKRIVCELLSTEKLEFPIIKNGKILVDDNFLRIIVRKSNENLEKTWEKIERFEKVFK